MLHSGLTGTSPLFECCPNVATVGSVVIFEVAFVGGVVVVVVVFFVPIVF